MDLMKIHYLFMAWKALCEPKFEGGLDFELVKNINLALLAKLAWKLTT